MKKLLIGVAKTYVAVWIAERIFITEGIYFQKCDFDNSSQWSSDVWEEVYHDAIKGYKNLIVAIKELF